jgi:hypothetical protein
VSALSLLLLSTSPVFAQAAPVAPEAKQGDAKTDSADVACAGAAAYSAGSGPQVHVVRRGSIACRMPCGRYPGDVKRLSKCRSSSIRSMSMHEWSSPGARIGDPLDPIA